MNPLSLLTGISPPRVLVEGAAKLTGNVVGTACAWTPGLGDGRWPNAVAYAGMKAGARSIKIGARHIPFVTLPDVVIALKNAPKTFREEPWYNQAIFLGDLAKDVSHVAESLGVAPSVLVAAVLDGATEAMKFGRDVHLRLGALDQVKLAAAETTKALEAASSPALAVDDAFED